MKIVVIGSGRVGGTITRRLTHLGHDVLVANARGPETLEDLVRETGATATSTADLPADADVVVLAIPFAAIPDLPPLPRGAVVVDAANYVPGMRDPEIPAIEAGEPESTWTAERLGRPIVKALNTIAARSLKEGARPRGAADRIAAPVAGDDEEAKQRVVDLVDALGFRRVRRRHADELVTPAAGHARLHRRPPARRGKRRHHQRTTGAGQQLARRRPGRDAMSASCTPLSHSCQGPSARMRSAQSEWMLAACCSRSSAAR